MTKKNYHVPKLVGKKELINMIDSRLFQDLESQSVHHDGILNLAYRFAGYVCRIIPEGKSTFLEVTLSQAIAEWHCAFFDGDIKKAYNAYCTSIFKALPKTLNYTVIGKGLAKPHYNFTWDCTTQSITDWFHTNKINPAELHIIAHESNNNMDPRDASFMLCTRVFSRQDLSYLGVIEEIHAVRS